MKYFNYLIIKKVTLLSSLLLSFSNNYSATPSTSSAPSASLKHMFVELNPTEKNLLTNYLKNIYLDIYYNEKKDRTWNPREYGAMLQAIGGLGEVSKGLSKDIKDSRTALQKGSKKAFSLSLKILSNLKDSSEYETFFKELEIEIPKPKSLEELLAP